MSIGKKNSRMTWILYALQLGIVILSWKYHVNRTFYFSFDIQSMDRTQHKGPTGTNQSSLNVLQNPNHKLPVNGVGGFRRPKSQELWISSPWHVQTTSIVEPLVSTLPRRRRAWTTARRCHPEGSANDVALRVSARCQKSQSWSTRFFTPMLEAQVVIRTE